MNKCDCGLLTKESVAIPLKGVEVKGVITGRAAKVKVKQHFANADTNAVEAVYKFPLPENSAVCGFKAVIGEDSWEAEIEGRDEAFKRYDEALAKGDGAYLLDEERPNIFTLSLGNLNPNTSAVIEIDYVITLDTHGQGVRFFLPTTISPRYVPDGMEKEDIPVEDIVNPAYAGSVPYGLSIYLDVHGAAGVSSVSSPSHGIMTRFSEGLMQVEFSAQTVAMDRDFILDITYKDGFRNRSFIYTDEEAKYIQLDFSPSLQAPAREHDHDTEIIFVLDCSGSMTGSSIEEAKQALTVFLKGMDRSMHFNIYRFGSRFEKLFEVSKPYTQDHLDTAVNYLSTVDADLGGTELLAPLRDIYDTRIAEGSSRKVILITDGEIGNEQAVSRLVQSNAQTTSLFVVGIGYGPNEYLIKQLARSSGGAADCIAPGDRIEPRVLRLFKKVTTEKISNCTVNWDFQVDQAPSRPVIYNEETTSVFGKTHGDLVALNQFTVTGDYMGSKQEWEIDVQPVTGADIPVSLLWARERIRDLEEGTASVKGSKQSRRGESGARKTIIALSKKYGILSRETSFVAVEKRPESQRTTGDTVLRRIPVMLTKDWHGGVQYLAGAKFMAQPSGYLKAVGRRGHMLYSAEIPCTPAEPFELDATSVPGTAMTPDHQSDPLLAMLALQRAEGGFELDEAVTKVIGLSYANLRECSARIVAQGRVDRWLLLSTIIVLRILEREFAGDRAVWYAVIQKSQKWYEDELSRVEPSIDGMDLSDWADHHIENNKI
jgi:Ca-activated chloride channel homolog